MFSQYNPNRHDNEHPAPNSNLLTLFPVFLGQSSVNRLRCFQSDYVLPVKVSWAHKPFITIGFFKERLCTSSKVTIKKKNSGRITVFFHVYCSILFIPRPQGYLKSFLLFSQTRNTHVSQIVHSTTTRRSCLTWVQSLHREH